MENSQKNSRLYPNVGGQKVCQNIANSKKRLEYVDLMKGICITLVVATHCGVCIPHYLPLGFEINMALINIRMPLYFSLSGFFFKEYMSFSDFVVRKVNKLIVPYVFFAIFPYALLFVIWPETIPQNTQGIYIPLRLVIEPMNGTLWFLRALFLTYLLYYAFHRISHSWPEVVKLMVTLAVANDHELDIKSTMMYRHDDYVDGIRLVNEGKVHLKPLISKTFAFKDYLKAYQYIDDNRETTMKVIINVQED